MRAADPSMRTSSFVRQVQSGVEVRCDFQGEGSLHVSELAAGGEWSWYAESIGVAIGISEIFGPGREDHSGG